MKTINSKFKEGGGGQLVAVDQVNATAQGTALAKKKLPPSSTKGRALTDGLPSPPTAGARSTARAAHHRSAGSASDLFARSTPLVAESPPAKPVPGLGLGHKPAGTSAGAKGGAPGGKPGAAKDADSERRKPCNCKNSKCLKL
jgi:hypothetical protein